MDRETEELLGKALAGELLPGEAGKLAEILSRDRDLAAEYEKDARFGLVLRAALAGPEAKARFERETAARVRPDRAGPGAAARLAEPRRWMPRLRTAVLIAASAAAILMAVRLGLRTPRVGGPEARPEVVRVSGDVRLSGPSATAPVPGRRLNPGAEVRTGPGGSFSLSFPDGTEVEIEGDSTFFLEAAAPVKRLGLARGLLRARVAPQPRGCPMILETPQARAEVLGTRLTLNIFEGATGLAVEEGRVRLTRLEGRDAVVVAAGFRAVASPGRELKAVPIEAAVSPPDAAVPLAGSPIRWQPLHEPGCGGWITSIRVSPHDSRRVLVGGDVLGIGLSEDRGETWQGTYGLRIWEIGDLTWHPSDPRVAWAGTMGGPYVSLDGGRTWQLRRRGMPDISEWMFSAPIERVLFDPKDPRRLIAVGGSSRRLTSPGTPMWGAVWESRDGGETWTHLSTITASGSSPDRKAKGINIVGAAFAAGSSDRLYAAVDGNGLYASADGGRTWERRHEGLPHTAIERVIAHPSERDTLWILLTAAKPAGQAAHLPGGVFKSVDGGRSWIDLSRGLPAVRHADFNHSSNFKGFDVAASNPDVMYVGECSWSHGAVYRSSDGGRSWRAVATKQGPGNPALSGAARPETAYFAGLCMTVLGADPKDPDAVFGGGSESVIRTLDGGKSWIDATAVHPPGSPAWRGRGYSGLCSVGFRFDPCRKDRSLILAMDAGKCWESVDGLKSWVYRGHDPWPWGGGNDASFSRDGTTYATTGQFGSHGGVLRTTDGKTWKILAGKSRGLPEYNGPGIATGVHTLPDDSKKVWAVVGGRLYRSRDGGEQWTEILQGNLGWIAADPRQPRRFYVSGAKGVLMTEDGDAFRPIGGPKPSGRMDCDRLGRLYVTGYRIDKGAGLWRWSEGRWTRLLDEFYASNVAVDPADPNRLALATNDDPYHDVCKAAGVWLSADAGKSWFCETEGLSMLRGHAVAFNPFDPEQLVYGTLGRGYFVARWPKGYAPKAPRSYAHTPADDRLAASEAEASRRIALVNGSMTAGGDVPEGWEGVWGGIRSARDTTVFARGPASLRVDGRAGQEGQAFQRVEARGGLRLRVRGTVKCSGRAGVSAGVQAFDDGWTRNQYVQLQYVQGDAGWTPFEREIVLPEWTARFNVHLLVKGEGSAWLDEVEIEVLD